MSLAELTDMNDDTKLYDDQNGNSLNAILTTTLVASKKPYITAATSAAYENLVPRIGADITYSGCSIINCVTKGPKTSEAFGVGSTKFNNCKFLTYTYETDQIILEGRFGVGYGHYISTVGYANNAMPTGRYTFETQATSWYSSIKPTDWDITVPEAPDDQATEAQVTDAMVDAWTEIRKLRPYEQMINPTAAVATTFAYYAEADELVIRWRFASGDFTKVNIGNLIAEALSEYPTEIEDNDIAKAEHAVVKYITKGWINVHSTSLLVLKTAGNFTNSFKFTGGNSITSVVNANFCAAGVDESRELTRVLLENGKYRMDKCVLDVLDVINSEVDLENCMASSVVATDESTVVVEGGVYGVEKDLPTNSVYYLDDTDFDTESKTRYGVNTQMLASAARRLGIKYSVGEHTITTVGEVTTATYTKAATQPTNVIGSFNLASKHHIYNNNTGTFSQTEIATLSKLEFGTSKDCEIEFPHAFVQIGTFAIDGYCTLSITNARFKESVLAISPTADVSLNQCVGMYPTLRSFSAYDLHGLRHDTLLVPLAVISSNQNLEELDAVYGPTLNVTASSVLPYSTNYHGKGTTPYMRHTELLPNAGDITIESTQNHCNSMTAYFDVADCVFDGMSSVDYSIDRGFVLPYYTYACYTGSATVTNLGTLGLMPNNSPVPITELLQSRFLRCRFNGGAEYLLQGLVDMKNCYNMLSSVMVAHGSSVYGCRMLTVRFNPTVHRHTWYSNTSYGVRYVPCLITNSDVNTVMYGTNSLIDVKGNGTWGAQTEYRFEDTVLPAHFDSTKLFNVDGNFNTSPTLQLFNTTVPYPTGVVNNTCLMRFFNSNVTHLQNPGHTTVGSLVQIEFNECTVKLLQSTQSKALFSYRFVDSTITEDSERTLPYAFMFAQRTTNAFARLEIVNSPQHVLPTNVILDCVAPVLMYANTLTDTRSPVGVLRDAVAPALDSVRELDTNTDATNPANWTEGACYPTYLDKCSDIRTELAGTVVSCGAFVNTNVMCSKANNSEMLFANSTFTNDQLVNSPMPVVLRSSTSIATPNRPYSGAPVVLVYTGKCSGINSLDTAEFRVSYVDASVEASTVMVGYNKPIHILPEQYVTSNSVFMSCNIVVDNVTYNTTKYDDISDDTFVAPRLRFVNNHFVNCKFTNVKTRSHNVLNPRIVDASYTLMNSTLSGYSMPSDIALTNVYNHISMGDFYSTSTIDDDDGNSTGMKQYVPVNHSY